MLIIGLNGCARHRKREYISKLDVDDLIKWLYRHRDMNYSLNRCVIVRMSFKFVEFIEKDRIDDE